MLQNAANPQRVHQISLTEVSPKEFTEFPDAVLQPQFDASDRMFAAAAHAHPDKPPIWQAADSKWLAWWRPLGAHGVQVEFLCPADVRRFYAARFPQQPVPELPNGA